MKVKVKLKNLDGIDIGEYITTDGTVHLLYSPYNRDAKGRRISTWQMKCILKQHSDITYADVAVALISP